MNVGDTTPDQDTRARLTDWMAEKRKSSSTRQSLRSGTGYIESAQMLVRSRGFEWDHHQLKMAASSAKSRYWNKFVPTQEGIEVRLVPINSTNVSEYWCLGQNGNSYSVSLLREDYEVPRFTSSQGHPEKSLWFDLAIRRIAIELMDSAKLYKELAVAPDEPFLLTIKHSGLKDRTFYTSAPEYILYPRKVRQADVHVWQEEVTQDLINSQLVELTHKIASSLFALFDFTETPKDTTKNILERLFTLH